MADKKGQALSDQSRLAELTESGLLDVHDDEVLNRYARIAAKMLDVPVSAVSLVIPERQHFAGNFGLTGQPAKEHGTPISHSFCQFVVMGGESLSIQDARTDSRVMRNPAVSENNVISYLGVPIVTKRGNILGSFCVIDGKPRIWSPDDVTSMEDLVCAVVDNIEYRLLNVELRRTVKDLKAAEERRDELLHMIVHDLRSPLNAIVGGLELLALNEAFSEEDHALLRLSRESCDTLLGMINNMLDVQGLRAGKMVLELSRFKAGALKVDLSNYILLLSQRHGIEADIEIKEPELEVDADQSMLVRVLQNLYGNAIKFTPKGGRVDVRCFHEKETDSLIIEVEDTGPGIDEEDLKRIFDPYFTGKHARKIRTQSSGIGLAFCLLTAEAHGGTITVESEVGKGSCFRVTIPRTQ